MAHEPPCRPANLYQKRLSIEMLDSLFMNIRLSILVYLILPGFFAILKANGTSNSGNNAPPHTPAGLLDGTWEG